MHTKKQTTNDVAASLPPHPGPLPRGEGETSDSVLPLAASPQAECPIRGDEATDLRSTTKAMRGLPLPEGEGRGEEEEPVQLLNDADAHSGIQTKFLTHF